MCSASERKLTYAISCLVCQPFTGSSVSQSRILVQPLIVSTLSLVGQNQCIGDHDYIQFMTRDNPGEGVTG